MVIKRVIVALLLEILVLRANAKLGMELDSSHVQIGQTIRLTLTMDESKNKVVPDLTPVRKDFNVIGTQQTVNYTVINGQAQSLSQWIVLLMPKRTGQLLIPSIQVGSDKTKATPVTVVDHPASIPLTENTANSSSSGKKHHEMNPVELFTQVNQQNPYVNQQIIYTVKLYNSQRLLDADYEPPQVKNALIITLGNTSQKQIIKHGIPYRVETLSYAIFPQKSGTLKITPPRFSALLFDTVPGKIQVQGNMITLDVKPAPSSQVNTPWLPAKQVVLTEVYDKTSPQIEEGGMIVRTITLNAVGLPAQLLPKIPLETNDQFSVYPEKSKEDTTYQQGNLVGTMMLKVSYLFNQTGDITMPELKLAWFNTDTKHLEWATLPARHLTVKNMSISKKIEAPVEDAFAKNVPKAGSDKVNGFAWWLNHSNISLAWGLAIGFGLAWLITLCAWWRSRQVSFEQTSLFSRKKLREACMANDAIAAKTALIHWAQQSWPDASILNLDEVAHRLAHPTMKKAIHALSEALYGRSKSAWNGEALWGSFNQNTPEQSILKKKPKTGLPPLNP